MAYELQIKCHWRFYDGVEYSVKERQETVAALTKYDERFWLGDEGISIANYRAVEARVKQVGHRVEKELRGLVRSGRVSYRVGAGAPDDLYVSSEHGIVPCGNQLLSAFSWGSCVNMMNFDTTLPRRFGVWIEVEPYSKKERQRLALAMATSSRLGAASPLRMLNEELLRVLCVVFLA